MARAADFTLSRTDAGRTVVCTGDWTAIDMGLANERLTDALSGVGDATVDLRQIGRCDTAGAYGILRAAQAAATPPKLLARPELDRLLELVDRAIKAEPTPHFERH
jgi:phospholipid/cholesterol/gamma-HCH transport system permease protein